MDEEIMSEEEMDLIDIAIAESRKGEDTFTLEEVTEELIRTGKLSKAQTKQ